MQFLPLVLKGTTLLSVIKAVPKVMTASEELYDKLRDLQRRRLSRDNTPIVDTVINAGTKATDAVDVAAKLYDKVRDLPRRRQSRDNTPADAIPKTLRGDVTDLQNERLDSRGEHQHGPGRAHRRHDPSRSSLGSCAMVQPCVKA